ncbi:4'-phosphopantetheinyl transferase family protein [Primorskyibacter sp. S87]|uniref:4'-phosphopantetheinyl transferase family protein n=1 Tax=Primorskyibacter sp. S87 TaxID=3415126 RepID=UPI003C7ADA27
MIGRGTSASPALLMASQLLDPDIALAAADPRSDAHRLLADEFPAIATAVPKRQCEFSAGRTAARQAMAGLGLAPQPVPSGDDRAPRWPAHLVGSITHTDHDCLAAVAHARDVQMLGIDLEPATPLDGQDWDTVCTAGEQQWLALQSDPGLMAKLIFCIKEATYKAQYPQSRTVFGFDVIETEIDHDSQRFSARFVRDVDPFQGGDTLAGRFAIGYGLIVAVVAVRA